MKRFLSTLIAGILLVTLMASAASAVGFNIAGSCETVATIKHANSSKVVKDGIIGDGEYTEIEINRDPLTSDLMLSWDGDADNYTKAEAFLENVHFYTSWDEKNGLNIAIKSTLFETPRNTCSFDSDFFKEHYSSWGSDLIGDFLSDEFLFQFGASISIYHDTGELDWKGGPVYDEMIYRGFSKNTETGEILVGDYGLSGYAIRPKQNFGEYGYMSYFEDNLTVGIDGNTVTYEISFPLESVLPATSIENGAPTDGAEIHFNFTATGGSQGEFHYDYQTYAVSIGDYGYITSSSAADPRKAGIGYFSLDPVSVDEEEDEPGEPPVQDPDDKPGDDPVQDPDDKPVDDPVQDPDDKPGDPVQDPDDKPSDPVQDPDDKPGDNTGNNNNNSTNAPQTADPAALIALVGAVTAAGAMICRKRK